MCIRDRFMAESMAFRPAKTSEKYAIVFHCLCYQLTAFIRDGKQKRQYCDKRQYKAGDRSRIFTGNERRKQE